MKIAVLTSGGVDSSVALKILKDQGHDLTAYYLKIWLEDELSFLGDCPWEEDLSYVRQICERENVPLKVVSLQKEYFDTVVKYTIDAVKAGLTPNPDVMCNSLIKFGFFLSKIDESYDKIATGHYAQIEEKEGSYLLKRAPDKIKDQTYFLANLKQDQIRRLIFPIGELSKEDVRRLAHEYDLPNKDRKDSQGICFLGKLKYNNFIKHYLGISPGDIIEYETGKKLGTHEGFHYYTIGQRKGIKLPDGPWFVVDKDSSKNTVLVSKQYHSPDMERSKLQVGNFNWFGGSAPKKTSLQVKLRHGEHLYDCEITDMNRRHATLKLNQNDQGIAPGQFAVFYDGNLCLGSAVIS
ncbi:tRNA 2-thiouridine(34) synthase MnmA [Candidatus Peregrinibacteria bacterium]|nr:tRNA 2-thiouridine(34) synthase MnmA [Candidatus Peregrinibacteria bacterium]